MCHAYADGSGQHLSDLGFGSAGSLQCSTHALTAHVPVHVKCLRPSLHECVGLYVGRVVVLSHQGILAAGEVYVIGDASSIRLCHVSVAH